MPDSLDELIQTRKLGNEPFLCVGRKQLPTLLEFWQWSTSDLVSNTTRGRLAEFIVAHALGIDTSIRKEWDAFDLETASGMRIEVKSCAYLQSWKQTKPSSIVFRVPKTRAWESSTNILSKDSVRQADIYVFAILAHDTKATLDPLNLDQWHFYLLQTSQLNDRPRSQHSITLKSLQAISTLTMYKNLSAAVQELDHLLRPEKTSPPQKPVKPPNPPQNP